MDPKGIGEASKKSQKKKKKKREINNKIIAKPQLVLWVQSAADSHTFRGRHFRQLLNLSFVMLQLLDVSLLLINQPQGPVQVILKFVRFRVLFVKETFCLPKLSEEIGIKKKSVV